MSQKLGVITSFGRVVLVDAHGKRVRELPINDAKQAIIWKNAIYVINSTGRVIRYRETGSRLRSIGRSGAINMSISAGTIFISYRDGTYGLYDLSFGDLISAGHVHGTRLGARLAQLLTGSKERYPASNER